MPDMPCRGVRFARPNRIWCIFEGVKDYKNPDLPGAYVPFSWNIFQYVVSCPELSVRELKREAIDKKREAEERRKEQRAAEYEYKQRDLDRYADKLLSQMSETEMKERLLGGAAPKATRPSVLVGKSAAGLPGR
jgi:hypothetical protein